MRIALTVAVLTKALAVEEFLISVVGLFVLESFPHPLNRFHRSTPILAHLSLPDGLLSGRLLFLGLVRKDRLSIPTPYWCFFHDPDPALLGHFYCILPIF